MVFAALGLLGFLTGSSTEIVTLTSTPEVRRGVTYVAATGAGAVLDAQVRWDQARRAVLFFGNGHRLEWPTGTPWVVLDGKRLPNAPEGWVTKGVAMIPFRALAKYLHAPMRYVSAFDGFVISRPNGDRIVPMPSRREGFVVLEPKPMAKQTKAVRIRGLANLEQGRLIAQLRGVGGAVIDQTEVRTSFGCYAEFDLHFIRASGAGGEERLDVVLFSKDRQGSVKHKKTIPVQLQLSDLAP